MVQFLEARPFSAALQRAIPDIHDVRPDRFVLAYAVADELGIRIPKNRELSCETADVICWLARSLGEVIDQGQPVGIEVRHVGIADSAVADLDILGVETALLELGWSMAKLDEDPVVAKGERRNYSMGEVAEAMRRVLAARLDARALDAFRRWAKNGVFRARSRAG